MLKASVLKTSIYKNSVIYEESQGNAGHHLSLPGYHFFTLKIDTKKESRLHLSLTSCVSRADEVKFFIKRIPANSYGRNNRPGKSPFFNSGETADLRNDP